jgi:ABC-type dipeptide/oligopeptide/nickel transport system permease subunit
MSSRSKHLSNQLIIEERSTFTHSALQLQRAKKRRQYISPHLVLGVFLLSVMIVISVFAPLIAPFLPDQIQAGPRFSVPNGTHLFGTDAFGRDLFSRVVYGGRIALRISLITASIAAVSGVLLGLIAGYYRGWLDQLLSRFMDAWLSIPGLLLAIVLIARMGPSLSATILALGITGIPAYYRLTRNETLSLTKAAYIEAAHAIGARDRVILLKHILPNISGSLIVLTSMRMGFILLAAGGLSFIGLGAQPPEPEWGALMAAGRDYIHQSWWMIIFPGLALMITVMGFNLTGDGLRDQLSPGRRRR